MCHRCSAVSPVLAVLKESMPVLCDNCEPEVNDCKNLSHDRSGLPHSRVLEIVYHVDFKGVALSDTMISTVRSVKRSLSHLHGRDDRTRKRSASKHSLTRISIRIDNSVADREVGLGSDASVDQLEE